LPNDDGFDKYTLDAAEIPHAPRIVLLPRTVDQIREIIRTARQHDIPIVARGAGTGYSGGAVPTCGGAVLSIEKMTSIIEIDPDRRTALVETGVITYDLDSEAQKHGLFYPPDPASQKESTVAGNIAECAGGLRCVKYGVTRDYVLGLEMVTSDGELIKTGMLANNEDVPDITSLLIGSEGTLGIVTKALLKLIPIPECRETHFLTFADEIEAASLVGAIRNAGTIPCVLEFMDRGALHCSAGHLGLDNFTGAGAVLLVELDGSAVEVAADSRRLEALIESSGALSHRRTSDDTERDSVWQLRRELSTAVKSQSAVKTSEDVCVPLSKFTELVKSIQEIGKHLGVKTASFGHAGDGNLHVCFLVEKLDDTTSAKIEEAKEQLLRAALEMRGTISGEHGIGFTKKPHLLQEVGAENIDLFRRVKSAFDPTSIVNPDKIFDL